MKLHIGCGTVYLKDWINVDLPSSTCYLTEERPDLVKAYLTTEKKGYYARHKKQSISKFRRGSLVSEYVCDRYGSFFNLPCRTSNATEILARQSFEHLSITEAKTALKEMNRVLCSRGLLRIDVPDADETLRKLKQTKDDFYIRHYLGPQTPSQRSLLHHQ